MAKITDKFAVVRFVEDDSSVSEVPLHWLEHHTMCRWPSMVKNVGHLIASEAPVAPNWSLHRIEVESFCETLTRARQLAAHENNLSSDDRAARKRPTAVPVRYSEDLTSNESDTDYHISSNKRLCKFPQPSEVDEEESSHLEHAVEEEVLFKMDTVTTSPEPQRGLVHLEEKIDKLIRVVADLTSEVENLKCKSELRHLKSANDDKLMEFIPFHSIVDMEKFEKEATDDDSFRGSFVNYISCIGGNHFKDTLFRILRHIFTNKFATKCSWLGRRGNISVRDLYSITILKDFILKTYPCTSKEFEVNVSEWFRHAKQRLDRELKKI